MFLKKRKCKQRILLRPIIHADVVNSLHFVDYSQLHKEQLVARSAHPLIHLPEIIYLTSNSYTAWLSGSSLQLAVCTLKDAWLCVGSYRVRSPKPLSASEDRSHQSTGHMRRSAQTRTKKGLLCKYQSAKYIDMVIN